MNKIGRSNSRTRGRSQVACDPTGRGTPRAVSGLAKLPILMLSLLFLSLRPGAVAPTFSQATVYYVRPDGGDTTQCTGLVNAPYPGSGTNRPCAWDHPFRALPPGGPPRITGGDTLIIGAGTYRMGYGAPGADACEADLAYDCHMPPIPGGPDAAHPTRILGEGWDDGCPAPPQLWGAERPWFILNLEGTDNAEIACLEITDHSGCVEFHADPDLACERDTSPFGDWAAVGLYAADAENITLRHLNIHGLAHAGIWAGRLTDWTVEDVRLAGNGWVGWDGDLDGDDTNGGTLTFRRWTVEWNGCAETYPGGQPTGCWAQTAGGYGDGVGTGATGGDWIIEDSAFLHNTSDGLDLLYHRLGGSITIRRTIAEGNAGNQIKTNGPTHIENSIIIGNCGFFEGQSFTYNVDNCRAYGNALALNLQAGEQVTATNNTITGEGDCLIEAICEGSCDGSERVRLQNNILRGQEDFTTPGERTCLIYRENFPTDPVNADYNLIYNVKDDLCPMGSHDLCQAPALVNEDVDAFDARLTADSPAIDAGTAEGAPGDDFRGWIRDSRPDVGAYEWNAARPTATPRPIPSPTPRAWIYLPVIFKDWRSSDPPPQIAGCDVFPADNIWNTPIDDLPPDPNSDAYIATIGAEETLHADFGSGEWPPGSGSPIGIPYVDVPGDQPKVAVTFAYEDESDPGPYPIPTDAPIEGGPQSDGDRHVLVLDRDNCTLYELYDAWPQADGSWQAGSGAIFDLSSHALRPDGWTSADAAGLPILPGLVRYDEVAAGEIRHAIRFTAPQTRRAHVWPARHDASALTGSQYPPMGQRFRLRADFNIDGFAPEVQVILRAFKKYGIILADNGSAWYIGGVPDERWDNDLLGELHQVPGSAFEAVDVSSLMVDPDSGQVQP